jgi:hypothetical protein
MLTWSPAPSSCSAVPLLPGSPSQAGPPVVVSVSVVSVVSVVLPVVDVVSVVDDELSVVDAVPLLDVLAVVLALVLAVVVGSVAVPLAEPADPEPLVDAEVAVPEAVAPLEPLADSVAAVSVAESVAPAAVVPALSSPHATTPAAISSAVSPPRVTAERCDEPENNAGWIRTAVRRMGGPGQAPWSPPAATPAPHPGNVPVTTPGGGNPRSVTIAALLRLLAGACRSMRNLLLTQGSRWRARPATLVPAPAGHDATRTRRPVGSAAHGFGVAIAVHASIGGAPIERIDVEGCESSVAGWASPRHGLIRNAHIPS